MDSFTGSFLFWLVVAYLSGLIVFSAMIFGFDDFKEEELYIKIAFTVFWPIMMITMGLSVLAKNSFQNNYRDSNKECVRSDSYFKQKKKYFKLRVK